MKTTLHQEQPMIEKVANLNVICHPELSLSLFYRKLSLSLKIMASRLFQIQHRHKGSGFAISLYQCLLKQPLQNQTLRLLYAETNWSQWMKYKHRSLATKQWSNRCSTGFSLHLHIQHQTAMANLISNS